MKLGFKILKKISLKVIKPNGGNQNVGIKIVNYILGELVLATVDKGLKLRIDNGILTVHGKNHIELVGR